jgi:hypothetical protein
MDPSQFRRWWLTPVDDDAPVIHQIEEYLT